jgi:DnaJ-class molecular chaperone
MPRKRYTIEYRTNTKKYGEVVVCGLCHGSGIDHTHSLIGVKCEACNGVGKIRV